MASFAYLFERFPSFVQTFVYREAMEMVRQKMDPLLVSIRRPEDPAAVAESITAEILYLPESDEMRASADQLRAARSLPLKVHRAIPKARLEKDSNRLFEAVWLGPQLQRAGIKHVHAHFGGMAARTAWWLKELYGMSYSFTGHANDIFCENDYPITNADLVAGARFVVTETDFARRWMEEKYPRAKGRVFRVFNGIDSDFPPHQPTGDKPRILSVGRYVEKKGFGDLIRACAWLRENEQQFECLIVGGGPLEADLKAQIDGAGLGDAVQLLGPRSQKEVRELLASSHLFVLACVPDSEGGSDNLPTVIMEAMMCGVPVVSTRLAGVPEMIDHGQSGLLVEPHRSDDLGAAIASILRDPKRAREFSSQGMKSAREQFALERTTRSLKQLLVKHAGIVAPKEARDLDPELGKSRGWRWWR